MLLVLLKRMLYKQKISCFRTYDLSVVVGKKLFQGTTFSPKVETNFKNAFFNPMNLNNSNFSLKKDVLWWQMTKNNAIFFLNVFLKRGRRNVNRCWLKLNDTFPYPLPFFFNVDLHENYVNTLNTC